MEELKLVEDLGAVTSAEIEERLEKSRRNIIKQLNSLEILGQIQILEFHSKTIRMRLYIKNEIFKDLNKIA